ncbi:ABC transporter permease [Fulvivirga sp.]|uniref:ABC transporter permease n=3 Tax=Fulvivirga sp. TaxID=1931237 RepID=UPI0032EB983E
MNNDKKSIPPRLAQRLLEWFIKDELAEEVLGDLDEKYYYSIKNKSTTRAKLNYWYQVLHYLRPFALKNYWSNSNNLSMFNNYFKISYRNLLKYRSFSILNILGLSLGFTCSLLIFLWVQDEVAMDKFHNNLDRIYSITSREYTGHELTYTGYDTPGLLGEELKKVFPEVEHASNISWKEWHNFSSNNNEKIIVGGFYAAEDFFKIFSYPLILGSRENILNEPESIAISRKMADALFGGPEHAIGELIKLENYDELKVTGVFEDHQSDVSEKFDYIINWRFFTQRNEWIEDWHNSGPNTYIMLAKNTVAEELRPKIKEFIAKYDTKYTEANHMELDLQPYADRYLYSKFENGKVAGGRIELVSLFGLVALFILVIASINFMNLSTARSMRRAKEIGVRKVNGAKRISLIYQFLFEACIISSIAAIISLLLIGLILPYFNLLTGKQLDLPINSWSFWMMIIASNLIVGLLAGSYPAFLLSSFKPITILKQTVKNSTYSVVLRKSLVVFQFALSTVFIAGMFTISEQMKFVQSKDLGYQKDHLLYIPLNGTVAKNFETFKNKAMELPGVESMSQTSSHLIHLENTTSNVKWAGKDPDAKPVFVVSSIGYGFSETLRTNIVMGRDFSRDFNDSTNYIINESALKIFGFKEPIGKSINMWGREGQIVGVVKDFHYNSLHVPIEPIILSFKRGNRGGWGIVRVDPNQTIAAINNLEKVYKEMNPEFTFNYHFYEDEIGLLYSGEEVVKKLAGYFAFLAIFISCLGLLGLVMFTIEQRTKEVGIRKVLGARISQIATLLTKDFVKLVFLSILISFPIAYLLSENWLQGFEYHIELKWWFFAISGAASLAIAIATVSIQAIRASFINPADTIRSE